MKRFLFALFVLGIAVALVPMGTSQEKTNDPLARLMKEKLKNAQVMMEGVALSDFAKIRKSADELIQLSKTAEWMVHKTPRYEVYSNEFRKSVEKIYEKAKDKDIDGVARAYTETILTCVHCHQYVRELREARVPLDPRPVPITQAISRPDAD